MIGPALDTPPPMTKISGSVTVANAASALPRKSPNFSATSSASSSPALTAGEGLFMLSRTEVICLLMRVKKKNYAEKHIWCEMVLFGKYLLAEKSLLFSKSRFGESKIEQYRSRQIGRCRALPDSDINSLRNLRYVPAGRDMPAARYVPSGQEKGIIIKSPKPDKSGSDEVSCHVFFKTQ